MSVPRSMQRMVMVPKGSGMLAMMKSRKGVISGMLLVKVYAMDFFRLSKIRRPGGRETCERKGGRRRAKLGSRESRSPKSQSRSDLPPP